MSTGDIWISDFPMCQGSISLDVGHASGCDSEDVCDFQVEDNQPSQSPLARSNSFVDVKGTNAEMESMTSVHTS